MHYFDTKTSVGLARWNSSLNDAIAKVIINMIPGLRHWTNHHDSHRTADIATGSAQASRDIHVIIGQKHSEMAVASTQAPNTANTPTEVGGGVFRGGYFCI